ncbi:MAG: type IV secretion protein IcmD [Legionellales bacterium]|nr:type IV secretion protein IcmD [Legionellales bacterium]|tara:strand:- start:3305 stop:3751 length:447 start_codon:yes stop_codon:yes gene_type:complete
MLVHLSDIINVNWSLRMRRMVNILLLGLTSAAAFAEGEVGLGQIAVGLLNQYRYFAQLILGTAFIAGICFFIAALFKFKQHKDNPAQVTIGTPFAMLAISVGLLFLPGFIKPTGETLFGADIGNMSAGVSGDISKLPGAEVETLRDFV